MTDLDARKLLGFRLTTMTPGSGSVEQKSGEKYVSADPKMGGEKRSPVLGIKAGNKTGWKISA